MIKEEYGLKNLTDEEFHKFITNRPHNKIIPGWRYFHCEDCNHTWREKCRDVETPSQECCEKCVLPCDPEGWAYHPEWPLDKYGNLIDEGI